MIGDLHEPYQVRSSVCGADQARMLYTRRHEVPITFIRQESTRHVRQSLDEIRTVLRFFAKFLDIYRPDVMLTYGGDPITQGMIAVARRRGIPVVFAIHNFAYTDAPALFATSIIASCRPSSRGRHYRDKVGLDCQALPNPVDWERVRVDDADPRYRDVRQSGALQGGLSVCADRPGAGAAAARYSAVGRREPGDQGRRWAPAGSGRRIIPISRSCRSPPIRGGSGV